MAHLSFDELGSALGFAGLLPMPEASKPPAQKAVGSASASAPAAAAGGPVARDDTGPLPALMGNTNLPGCEGRGKFYITTAISYTNGMPHMGHAYEALTSDVVARWHRLLGERTFFLTGTDEHGQKIANTAEKLGVRPIDICDKYAGEFTRLNRRMVVSADRFVRTTQAQHMATAQALWSKCAANGDIYLDTYKGWYLEREETFVTAKDAEAWGYKDPVSGAALKEMQEEAYFFRLKKYREPILKLLEENPHMCMPDDKRAQVMEMLRAPMEDDLCVSRTAFSWGISVPEGFDQKHVMYVWIDALANYLSGTHLLDPEDSEERKAAEAAGLPSLWPADVHVIGKDILRFHCIYWPAFLLSAGLPLPRQVFSHGFVNDAAGKKMSKSEGNVVDPHAMLDKYPTDTFRFYLSSEAPYGSDLKFSERSLVSMHNGPLANTLGNLVHRGTNLAKAFGFTVPPRTNNALAAALAALAPTAPLGAGTCRGLVAAFGEKMAALDLLGAKDAAMEACRHCNNWIATLEPWKMKDDRATERVAVVLTTLEALCTLAHLLAPFLPTACTEILKRLGVSQVAIPDLDVSYHNLKAGTTIAVGPPLFPKLNDPADPDTAGGAATGGAAAGGAAGGGTGTGTGKKPMSANAAAAAAGKAAKDAKKAADKEKQRLAKEKKAAAEKAAGGGGGGDSGGGGENKEKKEKKKGGDGGGKKKGGAEEADGPDVCKLDLRVGRITKAWEHPSSEKLWCEEIALGEAEGPRTICSGLRAFYATAEDLSGRLVLVVANLKARKMGGVASAGMVLCASSPAHDVVKLVQVPAGAKIGDRVAFEGLPSVPPASAAQVVKKKIAETVVFGGQLVTVADPEGGPLATCGFADPSGPAGAIHAMVIEGCGKCVAPVPGGYTVA